MASLLLIVFFLQLAVHIVNAVGAKTINELLWTAYSKLPTPTARNASETTRLRKEVVRLKQELSGISAQDEFSRWAKLRRQHDKALAEHDKKAESVKSTRSRFDTIANVLRWICLTGLRLLLQFWFSKRPMFWLPQGWIPGYIEWIMAFPRAPTGSVSMQVWWIACTTVIIMVGEAVTAIYTLVQRHSQTTSTRQEPMAHSSSTTDGMSEEKKEL